MIDAARVIVRRFSRAKSGAAALEFAFVAPIFLLLYIGGVDLTRAFIFNHKMQNATTAIVDLVTQATDLSKTSVADTFDVADVMLSRFDATPIAVRVTVVQINAAGKGTVTWSVVRNMPRRAAGTAYTLPANLKGLRDFTLVVSETSHDYTPILSYAIVGSIPMSAEAHGRFRGKKATACTDCAK